jgi:hypothetical protein
VVVEAENASLRLELEQAHRALAAEAESVRDMLSTSWTAMVQE